MTKRIIFKPHLVENPNTYTLQDNGDGTHTLVPVPGAISQQGTPLTSENLNNTEQEALVTATDESALTTQIVVSIDGIETLEDIQNKLLIKIQANVTGVVQLVVMNEQASIIGTFDVKVRNEDGETDIGTIVLGNDSYAIFAIEHLTTKAVLVSSQGGTTGSGEGNLLSDGSIEMDFGYSPPSAQSIVTRVYADTISTLREIPVDTIEPTDNQQLWFKII